MSDLTEYVPSQLLPRRSTPATSTANHSAPYRRADKYRGMRLMLIWLAASIGMWAMVGLVAYGGYGVFRTLVS